jgi:hypothetical protein
MYESADMSAIRPLLVFACGLYIGKYYPQYVPLPQLSKENINKVLKYLESMERQTSNPPSNNLN